jgi:hypothetical protein
VSENRVPRRIFELKREELASGYRVGKLYNEKHQKLYSSLNIIRFIKSRRMGWAKSVAHMGKWKVRRKF